MSIHLIFQFPNSRRSPVNSDHLSTFTEAQKESFIFSYSIFAKETVLLVFFVVCICFVIVAWLGHKQCFRTSCRVSEEKKPLRLLINTFNANHPTPVLAQYTLSADYADCGSLRSPSAVVYSAKCTLN